MKKCVSLLLASVLFLYGSALIAFAAGALPGNNSGELFPSVNAQPIAFSTATGSRDATAVRYDKYGNPVVDDGSNSSDTGIDDHGTPGIGYNKNAVSYVGYTKNGNPIVSYDKNGNPIIGYSQGQPVYYEESFETGDVDGNGKVESSDARLALRAAVHLSNEPTDVTEGTAGYTAADYDKNGKVESSDARCILRVAVKLDPFG